MTKVLITGVTGQDGSNMADYLLRETDLEIYGAIRRISTPNYININDALQSSRFHIVSMDISDQTSVDNVISTVMPDYCVNFAAQSFVGESWSSPELTIDTNTMGVLRLLESIRKYKPSCRFYSAGSSEEFGDVLYSPQDINHPIRPRSPYGVSKAAARHIVKVYRESYNIYAIHSILFNHEGKRRGKEFVTRKITNGIAAIKKSLDRGDIPIPLKLGNIYTYRDWGDSEDFVRGVWMMLNTDTPKEYILATGESHSVKEFIDIACRYANIPDTRWEGEGSNTCLYSRSHPIMVVDPKLYRPAEVDILLGDATPMRELGWKPNISFEDLVHKMVLHDLESV